MQQRANPHGGRRSRPALVAPGRRSRRAFVTAALAAGLGVAAPSLASSSAAAFRPGSAATAAPAGIATPAATTPGVASPAPMVAAASVSSTTAGAPVSSATAAVQGYVAASGAALGKTGAAPAVAVAPALRKDRPRPVARWVNPLPEGAVTSCFGMRWGRPHEGVDLAAPDGTPIGAAGAGVVVAAGAAEGYGNAVLIDHGNGYLTHYGHLSAITVQVGDGVTAGQQIGNEGSTGHSTGPHLHFEVHQGFYKNPIEPTRWMHEHGVDIPGCVAPGTAPASPAA